MTTASRVCGKCGAKIFADARFCSACLLETGLGTFDGENDEALDSTAARMLLMDFGDYELLEEIGRGGQGVVYRARQKSLNRIVALKVIALGHWATDAHIKRFRLEAEAAASLDHPRIIPIYDIGDRDGSCYFSMKFVEGGQLDEVVRRDPIPIRRAAELVAKLARTVHYAHQRGILHRDIKPGNILLDASGEPHLTDFGLARLVEKESTITRTMEVFGTPSYMAPEQAGGQNKQLTTATDVYGLGAVTYHLLTGQPPFAGGTTYETIRQVLETEPRRPSLLNGAVNRDLETICLKCLEKEPAKRYGSAEALAEDFERFLRNEPIRSRRISKPERVWRWCKRKPVVASLAAGLVVVVVVGFAGVLWQLHRVQQEQAIEWRNLYAADMNLAHQAWEEGNLQRAQTLLRAHLPQTGREDLRGFEWRYLWHLCRDQSRFTFNRVNFSTKVYLGFNWRDLAMAADGHTVVTASGNALRWLDMLNQREVQMLRVDTESVGPLATASNQPGLIAYAATSGKEGLQDLAHAERHGASADKIRCISATGETLLGGGVNESCTALALSPDGTLLASGGPYFVTDAVRLWNVKTGAQIGRYTTEGATSIVFSPDGKHLVCATADTRIQILEIPTLRVLKTLEGHMAFVNSLAFDPTGKQLASADNDSQIILWSFPEGREVTRLRGHRGPVSDIAFAPDGRMLASTGTDHTVRLWNLGSPGVHTILHGHRGAVKSVLFSNDGKEIYTSSDDGTVKVWPLAPPDSNDILRHQKAAVALAFSPDGKLLASADYVGRTAWIWDMATRRRWEQTIGQHSTSLQKLAFSPDGDFLATAGRDNDGEVWNMAEKKMTFRFPLNRGLFVGIGFHPSQPILAAVAGNVRFWDARTGGERKLLVDPPAEGARRVAFSPDGKWIALGMGNGNVSVWNLATGHKVHSFAETSTPATQLCFSRDSTLLASGAENNRITIYDVLRQRPIKSIAAHTQSIWGMAFAPDDKTLVSTSWDGTIKFWCVANTQLALTLGHDGASVYSAAFSPAGDLLATCGADGTVRLWPAPSLAEIDAAEKQAPSKR